MSRKINKTFSPEELKNSDRIFKSATPKYTLDWYVKWTSSVILLCAMAFRTNEELGWIDAYLSFTGCMGWLYVGIAWRDRALIILNTAAVVILGTGIINTITI